MRKYGVAVAILASVFSLAQVHAGGEPETLPNEFSVQMTSADHEKVATHHDEVAREMRALARSHQRMKENYLRIGGALVNKLHLDEHCQRLVELYTQAARTHDEIAAAHRQMAETGMK